MPTTGFEILEFTTLTPGTDGFRVRVVNPAFGEAVGVAREQLRDRSLLDIGTAVDSAAVEQLTDALLDELPLLVFLHVEHREPQQQPQMTLEPVAARILELVAAWPPHTAGEND